MIPKHLHVISAVPMTFREFMYQLTEPDFTDALAVNNVQIETVKKYCKKRKKSDAVFYKIKVLKESKE